MEKKLYSSGYHIEWLHSRKENQEFDAPEANHALPLLAASENSSIILPEETRSVLPIHENVLEKDTIVPSNPSKTDEEYVTGNVVEPGAPISLETENAPLNEKEKAKLDRLTNYLIISAILSIFPLYIFYIPILLINLKVINTIKLLARRSPYENIYLKEIKKYWRIICWPLYLMGVAVLLLIILLAIYGL
jgi:hypothetical protein